MIATLDPICAEVTCSVRGCEETANAHVHLRIEPNRIGLYKVLITSAGWRLSQWQAGVLDGPLVQGTLIALCPAHASEEHDPRHLKESGGK